jgi:hypothetical protein
MKAKIKFCKMHNAIIVSLLAMLGFMACKKEDSKQKDVNIAMYGIQPAMFIDIEKVEAEKANNSQPITQNDSNSHSF